MLVVADTSALVALAACDALPFLDQLFQDVRVPPAVLRECTVPGKAQVERLEDYLHGKVFEVDLKEFVIAVAGLGQGELEAMALCKRLQADRMLVDDYRARKVAHLNGIEVIGSLGVLMRAKEAGLVSEIRPFVKAIQSAGIRYGEQLVSEALSLAGEQ
jgi:predicted nucleic acid-binding protein